MKFPDELGAEGYYLAISDASAARGTQRCGGPRPFTLQRKKMSPAGAAAKT